MNLKNLYDRVLQLDAARKQIGAEIVRLNDADKFEEALTLQPKLEQANKDFTNANGLYLEMLASTADGPDGKRFVPLGAEPKEPKEVKDVRASELYRDRFIDALRSGATPKDVLAGKFNGEHFAPLMNVLSELGGSPTGSEGGFLLPVDFDNLIIERMRQFVDLSQYVNVESVTAHSGWRVIEAGGPSDPWKTLSENTEDDTESESPLFNKIDYTIVDKGGFLYVSSDLLNDTPANIMAYLARWFGKKAVLTKNALIIALLTALTPTDVADPDSLLGAIKTTLNKTLDPAISASATIFCNQTALDMLDQTVDDVGRPMLQPDPTNATAYRVKGRPVVLLSDALLENLDEGDNAPIAIGNGSEFATLFQRMPFEMASTTVGGKAWRSNNTEVKGIMRLDCKRVDQYAMALLSAAIPAASGS